jgi:hypothetical protein
MKFLPLHYDSSIRLLWRYNWRLTSLNLLCIVDGAACAGWYGAWLSHILQLDPWAPFGTQPNVNLWFGLFFVGFVLIIILFHLFGYLLMAAALRWSYGWSWARIRELMFESRIPAHWLK